MRIGSISKPITVAIAARLWQDGKLDLDEPIERYVKDWPAKIYDGKQVYVRGN